MWNLPPLRPDNILIYLRKSRSDDPALSVAEVLSRHEQMLDEWVERNLPDLGRVPEENRFREVVSGETIDSRPEIQALLRRIENPRFKAVLVVEPQRISRGDLEDIGRLVKLLRYSNTLVFTIQYNYNLSDERDRDLFERELKRGNEFLEYVKRIMHNGRILSMENGNFIANKPPYGYRKVQYKEGRRKCYTLEPIQEEARVVKLIFELYASGYGLQTISKKLDEMKVPTAHGSEWARGTLTRMLGNEHYLGKVCWEKRKSVKCVEDGEVVVSRPINRDYQVFPGKHPAIIDQELWDKVQAIRGSHPRVPGTKQPRNPLAGLLFCECGRSMSRHTYKRKRRPPDLPRYICARQHYCGNASCTEDEILQEVINALTSAIEDFDLKIKSTDQNRQIELHRQVIEHLERRYADLEKREITQWDKYTKEDMPKNIFDQLNAAVLKEKEEVQQALQSAKESVPDQTLYEVKQATFRAALEALKDPDAPVMSKNLLLKECIERIDYKRAPKKSNNRRFGTPEPMHLTFHLKI